MTRSVILDHNRPALQFRKRIRFLWKYLLIVAILTLLSLYGLNASRPGRSVEGCPDGCATSLERESGPLRVVSLNMLHGFPNFKRLTLRVSLITGEIKRLDADVVLLQEVPWTRTAGNVAASLAEQLGYNYLFYRANGNKHLIFFEEGEAILSRFPLKDVVFAELRPPAGLFESRVALGATAITPMGDMTFFVAHLTDKDPKVNAGQAQSLKSFVEEYAGGWAVVAGDFNAQEDSPQIIQLASLWQDTYRALHPGDPGLTCCIDDLQAGPTEPLEERIDYIFLVHQNGQLVSAEHAFDHPFHMVEGGWQWLSDHTGLMVETKP